MICQWNIHGACKLCGKPSNGKNLQRCEGYKFVTARPQPSLLKVLGLTDKEQLDIIITAIGKPPRAGCSEKSQWARKAWIKDAISYLAIQK